MRNREDRETVTDQGRLRRHDNKVPHDALDCILKWKRKRKTGGTLKKDKSLATIHTPTSVFFSFDK